MVEELTPLFGDKVKPLLRPLPVLSSCSMPWDSFQFAITRCSFPCEHGRLLHGDKTDQIAWGAGEQVASELTAVHHKAWINDPLTFG